MKPEDWDSGFGRSVGVFLNGDGIQGKDDRGRRITDVNFVLYFNAHDDDVEFTLPPDEYAPAWDVIIDTAGAGADSEPVQAGGKLCRRSEVARGAACPQRAGGGTGPLRGRLARGAVADGDDRDCGAHGTCLSGAEEDEESLGRAGRDCLLRSRTRLLLSETPEREAGRS